MNLAGYLDLANHRADAEAKDIRRLCQLVLKHAFNSAFVNSCYVAEAVDWLKGKAKVGSVISFPLGQDSRDSKVAAAVKAVRSGASELDVSMNVGWFKGGDVSLVANEMKAIVRAVKDIKKTAVVKFIIEAGYLDDAEIKKASRLVLNSGADFVKTCSGMGPRGSELRDVELIRQAVGDKIKVKVAGGVHTYDQAMAFIKAGADRIGTSKAVEIVSNLK